MGSQTTVLDPGVGGDVYQAYLPDDAPSAGLRQVIRIAGALQAQFASVFSSLPRLSDLGLVVRLAGNRSETTTVDSVPASTSSTILMIANAGNRIGASVFNNSTSSLYINTAGAASSSVFTVKILPGGYWECPFGYSGELNGAWDASEGSALVTEYT